MIQYACQIDMDCESSRTNRTPHERWYGFQADWDPPVFGARIFFRHNERDKGEAEPLIAEDKIKKKRNLV